jgi:hypothetical protein
MREVAFAHKQRAIQQALAMGEQIARRRARATLVACFTAWRIQVRAAWSAAAGASRRALPRQHQLGHHGCLGCALQHHV